ncbi:MAG TPA: NtaA/DmoA family FMN-dependent monooxygenase, partial [Hyphomicrobiaceae bacterium]|nr:NtaA/DmoA family FMN-dependent monooxygenase [Hyphomicrobiaceae bacterium]
RAGWNVVTSLNHNQAANYGTEREPTDRRYERAHEYIEVCRKLWDSWDDEAVVTDAGKPMFVDSSKVRRIEHEGEFFRSRGPLNVVRSPQNGPAILQAGTSPRGRDFAAKYADAIFAIQPNAKFAKAYYDDIKQGVADQGRDPNDCKMLFGIQPILGATEQEARDKQAEHNALVPIEAGLTILSAHLDFDLSKIPLDEPIAERTEPELQRMQSRFRHDNGSSMTLREAAARHGQSVGLPQFVGTAGSVADQMEAFIGKVGGDGFMLSPIYSPGAIEEFVDQVVPELQRRGIYRTAYKGRTQREILSED